MYFRARYYDPQTGEFISRDPLGYVDGISLYRGYFVPGNVDPSGRDKEVAYDWGDDKEEWPNGDRKFPGKISVKIFFARMYWRPNFRRSCCKICGLSNKCRTDGEKSPYFEHKFFFKC